MRLNIERLIRDIGGPTAAAALAGAPRTAPYRWIKSGNVSSRVLGRIKAAMPSLSIDAYFEDQQPSEE